MTWKKYFTWNTKKKFNLLLVSAEEGGVRKKVVHRDAFQLKTYITNVCPQMKEGRRLGGVHAGPESRVLDGVTWDEARQMQDAQPSSLGT